MKPIRQKTPQIRAAAIVSLNQKLNGTVKVDLHLNTIGLQEAKPAWMTQDLVEDHTRRGK